MMAQLTTLLQRLVRPVPAVSVSVAHLVHADALAAAALELVWAVAGNPWGEEGVGQG